MNYISTRSNGFISALFVLLAIAGTSFGQTMVRTAKDMKSMSVSNALVAPVFFEGPGESGNPDCGDLNALHVNGVGDVRFSHIITDNEMKLDFGTPNGNFPYTTGNGRFVTGPQFNNHSVTVSSSGSTVNSWNSTLQVTAVILKTGNDAWVFPYKPFKNSDTNLVTGVQQSISHLTFCYGQSTGTTAGDASITGHVVDSNGNGVARAQMILVNGSTGETKITLTSPFGYYMFNDLDVSELYVINASHKRFAITENQKTVLLMDSVADVDFIADPLQ